MPRLALRSSALFFVDGCYKRLNGHPSPVRRRVLPTCPGLSLAYQRKWSGVRGSNPHGRATYPVLHRAYCTPGFTERNGTIHGPDGAAPGPPESSRCANLAIKSHALPVPGSAPDRYISRPDLQEIPLSFAFCRMSSRFRAILTAGPMTPCVRMPFPPTPEMRAVARLPAALCSAPPAPAPLQRGSPSLFTFL